MASPKRIEPAQLARDGSEHGHQCALFCQAAMHFKRWPELELMFAIPNGSERNIKVASRLKAEGVKAGVPDIFLPAARGAYHGLFIELKRSKNNGKAEGRQTTEQISWMNELRKQGYGSAICVGWEAAWAVIEQYLNWK